MQYFDRHIAKCVANNLIIVRYSYLHVANHKKQSVLPFFWHLLAKTTHKFSAPSSKSKSVQIFSPHFDGSSSSVCITWSPLRLKSFSADQQPPHNYYQPNKPERGTRSITMVNTKASRHLNGPYFYSHYEGGGQKRWQNLSRFGHISSRLRANQCCKEIDLSSFTPLDGATEGSNGKKV